MSINTIPTIQDPPPIQMTPDENWKDTFLELLEDDPAQAIAFRRQMLEHRALSIRGGCDSTKASGLGVSAFSVALSAFAGPMALIGVLGGISVWAAATVIDKQITNRWSAIPFFRGDAGRRLQAVGAKLHGEEDAVQIEDESVISRLARYLEAELEAEYTLLAFEDESLLAMLLDIQWERREQAYIFIVNHVRKSHELPTMEQVRNHVRRDEPRYSQPPAYATIEGRVEPALPGTGWLPQIPGGGLQGGRFFGNEIPAPPTHIPQPQPGVSFSPQDMVNDLVSALENLGTAQTAVEWFDLLQLKDIDQFPIFGCIADQGGGKSRLVKYLARYVLFDGNAPADGVVLDSYGRPEEWDGYKIVPTYGEMSEQMAADIEAITGEGPESRQSQYRAGQAVFPGLFRVLEEASFTIPAILGQGQKQAKLLDTWINMFGSLTRKANARLCIVSVDLVAKMLGMSADRRDGMLILFPGIGGIQKAFADEKMLKLGAKDQEHLRKAIVELLKTDADIQAGKAYPAIAYWRTRWFCVKIPMLDAAGNPAGMQPPPPEPSAPEPPVQDDPVARLRRFQEYCAKVPNAFEFLQWLTRSQAGNAGLQGWAKVDALRQGWGQIPDKLNFQMFLEDLGSVLRIGQFSHEGNYWRMHRDGSAPTQERSPETPSAPAPAPKLSALAQKILEYYQSKNWWGRELSASEVKQYILRTEDIDTASIRNLFRELAQAGCGKTFGDGITLRWVLRGNSPTKAEW